MQNEHVDIDAKKMHHEFGTAVRHLADRDAGAYQVDSDKPVIEFSDILNGVCSHPIRNEDQLRILRKGIDYPMADDSRAPRGSIQKAMEAAMDETLRTASTSLHGALLALLRHQIQGGRIDPLNS